MSRKLQYFAPHEPVIIEKENTIEILAQPDSPKIEHLEQTAYSMSSFSKKRLWYLSELLKQLYE